MRPGAQTGASSAEARRAGLQEPHAPGRHSGHEAKASPQAVATGLTRSCRLRPAPPPSAAAAALVEKGAVSEGAPQAGTTGDTPRPRWPSRHTRVSKSLLQRRLRRGCQPCLPPPAPTGEQLDRACPPRPAPGATRPAETSSLGRGFRVVFPKRKSGDMNRKVQAGP